MGYYTNYTLKLLPGHSDGWTIYAILRQLSHDNFPSDMYYTIDEEGNHINSSMWYKHEDDMRKLSIILPDVVFKLFGYGEDMGDIWHKYFKNGKMQYCKAKMVFDKFEIEKLI